MIRVKIYDYELEKVFYMTLSEFEHAFNNDTINQTLCKIEFIGE